MDGSRRISNADARALAKRAMLLTEDSVPVLLALYREWVDNPSDADWPRLVVRVSNALPSALGDVCVSRDPFDISFKLDGIGVGMRFCRDVDEHGPHTTVSWGVDANKIK